MSTFGLVPLTGPKLTIRIDGQPPSGNHMYEGYGRNRRKRSVVAAYQLTVTSFVRQAMAAGYQPGKQIICNYWFNLRRNVDCTNIIKVIEDGIAEALCPGLDPPRCCRAYDARFLPRAIEKVAVATEPFVQVELVNVE